MKRLPVPMRGIVVVKKRSGAMKRNAWRMWMVVAVAGLCFSQSPAPSILPGSPLPGLTPAESELFRLGLADFSAVETPADGLGPAFNGNSCAGCHSIPAIGGFTGMTDIRVGHRDENGNFTALHGATLYSLFSIPDQRCQVRIPPEANVIARRAPPSMFGAGLVEAIPDSTIAAQEDPDDQDHDGVRGRVARVLDVATNQLRVGRYVWKAQQATLLAFSGDAYRNEMGITNDLFPDEYALGIAAEQLKLCSPTHGIEDTRSPSSGLRGIDTIEKFMKYLAPIERGPIDASVRHGEVIFRLIGCAACHTPVLMTGPSANPVFDRKPVPLYSDLLLHDVGTGDGIEQGPATGDEFRTPALWGLRFRKPLLHDGSAATLADAIRRHRREAKRSTERYAFLSSAEHTRLLAFLNSL